MQINKTQKRLAFSFAELLSVLAIIAVISSLALPGLKKHSMKTEYAKLTQKSYFTLQRVVDQATLLKGPVKNWSFSSGNGQDFFKTYLKPNYVVKDESATSYILTADSQYVGINKCTDKECWVCVDVNGAKPPNRASIDRHFFVISKETERVSAPLLSSSGLLQRNNWMFPDDLWNNPSLFDTFYANCCGNIFPKR